MEKGLLHKQIRDFFVRNFDVRQEKEDELETIESIRKGIEFKGTNLWVLIFATFVASLGLNTNSTAVIIGAMLISPLMGPIMGFGLGLGISDFDLIKRSFRNFATATVFSVITSTLFFLISPISEAQSELLARTQPTVYDVLIAFFGGLAGIVASSAKSKGNVIPGVAIPAEPSEGTAPERRAQPIFSAVSSSSKPPLFFLSLFYQYGVYQSGYLRGGPPAEIPEEGLFKQTAREDRDEICRGDRFLYHRAEPFPELQPDPGQLLQ